MANPLSLKVRIDFNKLPQLPSEYKRKVSQVVRKAAEQVHTIASTSMEGPKHGRIYGAHQASAPGEPPAIDTGKLRNSMRTEFSGDGLSARIGPNADPYDYYLEFGTSRMEPRPYMTPAADEVRDGYIKALEAALSQHGGSGALHIVD